MFDPYYETKVNVKLRYLSKLWGLVLIILGLGMIVCTIIDLTLGMTAANKSAQQENSIWPTIGKGIWVGALVVVTGLIEILVNLERTQVSLHVFNILSWVSAVFSLYLAICSILHIHPYLVNGITHNLRTSNQNIEFDMNVVLLILGTAAFLLLIFLGFLTCKLGHCCYNRRKLKDEHYDQVKMTHNEIINYLMV